MFDRPGQMMAVQPLLTNGSALMMSMWILGISSIWTQTALGANTPLVPSTFQVPSRYTHPPNLRLKICFKRTVHSRCAAALATDIPDFHPSAIFAITLTLVRSVSRHSYAAVLSTPLSRCILCICIFYICILCICKYLPSVQEYDRPNSAYMLFYERSGVLEPASQPASSATAVAEGHAEMPSLQQQQQQTDSANLQSSSLSPSSPEQSCTSQQAAEASAAHVRGLQAGSPMQTQPSAASSPQAVPLEAQESLQGHPQPSPTTALKEHLSSGRSSPVSQQPKSSPSGTPNISPHLANLSPLKVWPMYDHACML